MDGSKMLKLEGAVIHLLQRSEVAYLVGRAEIAVLPFEPYAALCCEFLNDLSLVLRNDKAASTYPDVMTFAFWCRKANIDKLKKNFADGKDRLGLGLVLHITPANVPINFAFSFAYGLISGNANIVRVPSKAFLQTEIISGAISQLLANSKYHKIKAMTALVRYEQNNEITAFFSALCNARIIWGGDETIKNIRCLCIPERAIELTFADRYSLCVIGADALLRLSDSELKRLAENFYNDNYFMGQNACSSAHLIVWCGREREVAQKRFWAAVTNIVAEKYELTAIQVIDKYTALCHDAIDNYYAKHFKLHGNYVYSVMLKQLPDDLDTLRGRYGYFYEYNADDLCSLARVVNSRYQTLTYFGMNKTELLHWVTANHLLGIDRIVPIGQALDMDVIWDGYDIIQTLSRIIDVK